MTISMYAWSHRILGAFFSMKIFTSMGLYRRRVEVFNIGELEHA